MTGDREFKYWKTNKEWYIINKERGCFELTEKAPERTIKSFEMYKQINNYKERYVI